ncbi:hypothetical protein ASPCAL07477 [Aspergillus calidoustus]|uniref:Uncharacterized protein n=1 Tax=Aspergillus calidoustus TaxID=454130 RepID=A0A0U5G442_ASPCI|nr:hypothetical protein ASPCAL07477 [Aspergillus calidoustus]
MKSALILPILLPATYAWTFTWRNADGEEHTERGRGPSECIVVDHAKGQLFELDGQGEDNINMLLFSNDDCSGDPAGRATESWSKESSTDLLSFEVVALNGGDDSTTPSGNATATATETETPSGTVTSQPTGTSTEETFTLPTVSETETGTETMSNTDAEPTPTETTEPTSTSEGGSEPQTETPTPTPTPTDDEVPEDAAQQLFSRNNLVGAGIAAVAGYAVNWLF